MGNTIKAVLATLAAAAATYALAAAPAAAQPGADAPSYAIKGEERITGRIASIPGKYTIHVRDDKGYVDNVSLHQGTIINPTGITLRPGFRVTIYGEASGRTFVANEIDTPYQFVPGAYYAYPYWGPYPYYGYGYGYGPYLGIGVGFHRWR